MSFNSTNLPNSGNCRNTSTAGLDACDDSAQFRLSNSTAFSISWMPDDRMINVRDGTRGDVFLSVIWTQHPLHSVDMDFYPIRLSLSTLCSWKILGIVLDRFILILTVYWIGRKHIQYNEK